jgi:hypothetical protein
MTDGLSDKVKSQIEEILSKFPEQEGLGLTKLREKAITRLRERLPFVLAVLAIDLILSPVVQGDGERLRERFGHVLTALVVEVIMSTVHEELEKLGRSKPCKHCLPDSELCAKGKEWGPACLNCGDYEPVEGE